MFVVHFANRLHHGAAQEDAVTERFAAQVEVAILQPQALVHGGIGVIDIEGWRLGLGEHGDTLACDLNAASGELLVLGTCASRSNSAFDGDHPLAARVGQCGVGLGCDGGINNHLHDAVAVTKVDEDEAAVISTAMNPTGEPHAPTDIAWAQCAADVAPKARGQFCRVGHATPRSALAEVLRRSRRHAPLVPPGSP